MKTILLLLAVFLAPGMTRAAVPGFIPYSGRLTDGALAGASTTANIRVLLYTCACAPDAPLDDTACTEATRCSATNASPWFDGFHPNVPVVDGYFSLTVGMYDASGVAKPDPANSALTAIPALFPERLWITVSVNGAAELSPRQPVGSVPFAMRSSLANSASKADSATTATNAGSGITATITQTAAVALCASASLSGGMASAVPLLSSNDTGTAACATNDPIAGTICKRTVNVWAGDRNYANSGSCSEKGGVQWGRIFACCD